MKRERPGLGALLSAAFGAGLGIGSLGGFVGWIVGAAPLVLIDAWLGEGLFIVVVASTFAAFTGGVAGAMLAMLLAGLLRLADRLDLVMPSVAIVAGVATFSIIAWFNIAVGNHVTAALVFAAAAGLSTAAIAARTIASSSLRALLREPADH